MSNGERRRAPFGGLIGVISLIAQLGLAACASNSAQRGFLPNPDEAQTSIRGGWVVVDVRTTPISQQRVSGELLAITSESLWVLGRGGTGYVFSRRDVTGYLSRYAPQSGVVAGVTALGVLSTISNGWFLVFTTPAWIITGISAAAHDSYAARSSIDVEGSEPSLAAVRDRGLAAFSRFPQGMPRGMDSAYTRLPKRP